MARKYVLGLDYGTESGRALLVAVDNGEEVATAVLPYPHVVIDTELPGTGEKLPPDWALQHPGDWLQVMETVIPQVLQESGISGDDIVGIGVDFTACTIIPVDEAFTPLSLLDQWAAEKHAWPKLWKHHGAQAQADRINDLAIKTNADFLPRYGGKVSSEWLFPKALQVLEEAPDVYNAAHKFIEAGDWIVWQLTGEEKRNACAAGYKAIWDEGYPSPEFLGTLNPDFANIVEEKLSTDIYPMGARAGSLTEAVAAKLGLKAGTAVAVAAIDAHVAVPGSSVTQAGHMVMIMGTSLCHMVCGTEKKIIEGMAGVVKDGILPGMYGFEAGQAAVGDIFAWFISNCVPKSAFDAADAEGLNIHDYLSREAEKLAVGESGVLCLDWWNGNRCVLVDAELSGMMVGMTLGTTPAEMYRAILESTAFGTYKIIRDLHAGGCPIDTLYACGGLPNNNPLCMQIFADVTGREIKIADSEQTVALGSAMWGAVAAGADEGGYDDIAEAAKNMAAIKAESFVPNATNHASYQALFAEYEKLHDYFGRGDNPIMKTLKNIKNAARG